jgi:hypothetical protein
VVDANQAGNGNYNAASQVQQTVTVGKGAQIISFTSSAPAAIVGGAGYTPVGSSTAGLLVTFTIDGSSTAGACSISGGVVSFTGAGSCVIDANQAGNGNFLAAVQVQQAVTVGKGDQTISFTTTGPSATVGGAHYTPAGSSTAGLVVTFTIDGSSTAGACSISGGVVSFTGVGSCVIDANQAGNTNYNAASQVQQTVTVGKGAQTISFSSSAPAAKVGGSSYTPTGIEGASGVAIVFTIDGSSTAGACSVSAGVISFTGAGTCIVDANEAGNSNYNAAGQIQQSFTVGKGSQTIAITTSAPSATVAGPGYTPAGSDSAPSLTVTFTIDGSSTPGACSISGGVISFTGAGSCVIDANQAGNGNYNAASQVQQTVIVGKGSQTVSITSSAPSATVGGPSYAVTGSDPSGLAIVFTIDGSSTAGGCSISGGIVSFDGVGTCVIDANQPGNANYNAAAQVQQTVTVDAGSQTVQFTSAAPAASEGGATYTPTATGGGSGEAIVFTIDPSSTSGVCDISGGVVSFTGVGTCVIDANEAGNANYGAAPQVQQSFDVVNSSTVAGAPTNVVATSDGLQQVTITWDAPGSNGGAAIGGYLVTSSQGNFTAFTTGATSADIYSLTYGTDYTFTVQALNANGYGAASSPSNGVTPEPPGYYLAGEDGGIYAYGAPFYGSMGGTKLNGPIVGITTTADGKGYWMVATDGGIFAFGDAGYYGSMGGKHLNEPVIGMQATPDGKGYWLVAIDGGIFAFGDAKFYGSTGSMKLNSPIIRMADTPDGNGYWMVATDGGIFAFGDAGYYGSIGGKSLSHIITSMTSSPDGKGYLLVDNVGDVFAFGDATSYGSLPSQDVKGVVIGISTSADGMGYWLVDTDGGVFNFGDATPYGSASNVQLNALIVGVAVA